MHGLTLSLTREGAKSNIMVNSIAPIAATGMTEGLLPEDLLKGVKTEFVAPLVLLLAHEQCPESGSMFEVGGGWVTKVRPELSEGLLVKAHINAEGLQENWQKVVDFSHNAKHYNNMEEGINHITN